MYIFYLQDVIVKVNVGIKNINRSSYTYTEVYQQLKRQVNGSRVGRGMFIYSCSYQKSGGVKLGGEYSGNGGLLELDISQIKLNNKNSSSYGTTVSSIAVGTTKNPYPISFTLMSISEALNPEYWTLLPEESVTHLKLGIARKKLNLEKALADYADYENVDELKGTC